MLIRFLKHIERCGVILHLVDATEENSTENYQTIRNELEKYSPLLADKIEILALNKCDALLEEDIADKKSVLEKYSNKKVYTISAFAGLGVKNILRDLIKEVEIFRAAEI